MQKAIQRNLNYDKYVQFFAVAMEESWFYEIFFFKLIIVMVKEKKILL